MAKTTPDKIILKGNPIRKEYPLKALDAYGVGGITPGMLIETDSGEVTPHSTGSGFASPLFAEESLNISPDSKTMGGIDDDYDVDGTAVLSAFCEPGAEVFAFLAAGEDVAADALLESNGDGYLKAGSTHPVVRALEAKDNDPGTDGAAVRIRVEVL